MIVYVETNFVLELAYEQETHQSCTDILGWEKTGRLQIVLPAFSAAEARLAWQNKVKRRNRLHGELIAEIRDLARSKPLNDINAKSQGLMGALVDTAEQDRTRLEDALAKLAQGGTIEPLTAGIVGDALRMERELGLSPQDAAVYATVIAHLQKAGKGEKLFITRNANDFANPTIEDQLGKHNCKLLTAFDGAAGYLKATLKL